MGATASTCVLTHPIIPHILLPLPALYFSPFDHSPLGYLLPFALTVPFCNYLLQRFKKNLLKIPLYMAISSPPLSLPLATLLFISSCYRYSLPLSCSISPFYSSSSLASSSSSSQLSSSSRSIGAGGGVVAIVHPIHAMIPKTTTIAKYTGISNAVSRSIMYHLSVSKPISFDNGNHTV